MSRAELVDGWICVPYDGPDLAKVELTIGNQTEPAYLDWVGDQRVAKLRPATFGHPSGPLTVTLRVDGVPRTTHRLTL